MCLALLYGLWVSELRTSPLCTKQFTDSPLNSIFTLLAKVFTECHGQGDSSHSCHTTNKAFVSSMALLLEGCPGDNTLKDSPQS